MHDGVLYAFQASPRVLSLARRAPVLLTGSSGMFLGPATDMKEVNWSVPASTRS